MTAAPSPAMLADSINQHLPQTQCSACGYPGCRPFADALAVGLAPVDGCSPGGLPLKRRLQLLTGQAVEASANALTQTALPLPLRAVIRERDCIGCTKCIAPCPVDAILGAPKQLHSVLTELCTGCGLCLPPCPVDCIELVPAQTQITWPRAESAAASAIRTGADITACTACGDCASACPCALAPAPLARALANADLEAAETLGLARCSGCGRCAEVCGERIPLTAYFIQGKAMAEAVNWQTEQASTALDRQQRRAVRETRAVTSAVPAYVAPPADPGQARHEILAALSRARGRRPASGAES